MIQVTNVKPSVVTQTKPQACNCKCCNHGGNMKPQEDSFEHQKMGIIPPPDWKPDPYAGLRPEPSPAEKLKQMYEDLKKPLYANQTAATNEVTATPAEEVQEANVEENEAQTAPEHKTFGQKLKDFKDKVVNYIKNLFKKS